MRFIVTPPDRITDELVQQAALASLDHVLWQVRTSVENGQLVLQRPASESGSLQVPWPVEGRGRVTLSTGTLIERPEPYFLPLELARGTVCQLRNQLADWQTLGLVVPEALTQRVSQAINFVGRAAVLQADTATATALADSAILLALDAGDLLVNAYIEQVMQVRQRMGAKSTVVLGADLGSALLDDSTARSVLVAFNGARVAASWREVEGREGRCFWSIIDTQIEWCRTHGLKVIAGPLLNLDARSIPDWLCLWEDDFDSILGFVEEHIRQTVTRYRGKVDTWICAGRINTGDVLALGEEERLRLAARAVELVHSLDPETACLVSLDQPWSEYLMRRPLDIPPVHLADALVRSGLNLTGLMLELNVGYFPGGTLPRTLLELHWQIEMWSGFGLPLWLSLTVPSSTGPDPLAARQGQMVGDYWNEKSQQVWLARHLPLILAKSYVQGVVWGQLCDSQWHDFPHGGLLGIDNRPKPALRTLAAARQAYVK